MVLFLFYTTNANISASHNPDDIIGWTWSNFPAGVTYYWNVTELTAEDIPVTDISSNILNIIEGSIISVTITENLQTIDYLEIVTKTGGSIPLEIRIDGKTLSNPGRLGVEFVFPNLVVWANGTLTNLFYMDTPDYNHQLQFSPYGSIQNSQYVINITQSGDQKIIARDIQTGLLNTWHLEFQKSVVTYERLHSYNGKYVVKHKLNRVFPYQFLYSYTIPILMIGPWAIIYNSRRRFM